MQHGATAQRRRLLTWGTVSTLGHYAAVVWHVTLLVKVQPAFPGTAARLLLLANLLPVAGLVAFAKGFPRLAGIIILVPLGIALVIGGYTHFLSAGSDNVFRMPPGGLTRSFQMSAILLALLEALACWVAIRMFAFMPDRDYAG